MNIARVMFMPLMYLLAVWMLYWVLALLQVPLNSCLLISMYVAFAMCIAVEGSATQQKPK